MAIVRKLGKNPKKASCPELPIEVWEIILLDVVGWQIGHLRRRMPPGHKERMVEWWLSRLQIL